MVTEGDYRNGVHPRSRGEYCTCALSSTLLGGSSPLTRGIHQMKKDDASAFGFIPAHAGNTLPVQLPCDRPEVHPRSRGEYSTASRSAVFAKGSSPLTRGIQNCGLGRHHGDRFIPAHAGNTPGGTGLQYGP